MAGLHFNITGDNSDFMNALRETETGIKNTAKSVESSGMSIETMFGKLSKAAAGLGVAFSAQQFISQMASARGEFQQLEVDFETMLGSTEKASALMAQITRTAAVTPFGLQDVAGGAKQLLAYGVAAEEVNDTLVRLGDIAAGLSIPLNDLVYLYGTTMTQGRMFTQDLRQFQGRGIPLADELAKQFGVTKDAVGDLVTAGKVGFKEMQQAIISMTSEGGKFGGLMEAQSKTITGQISNIEDAIDQMFNEIGKSSEGVINLTLSGVSAIVENYELVGKALMAVVTTYGAYRAAVIANIALTRSWAVAARADAAAKAIQTAATKAQTIATIALNTALKANPFVLVATGVVALGTAMWALSDGTTTAERALMDFNAEQEKMNTKEAEQKKTLEDLVKVLQDENTAEAQRMETLRLLDQLYPEIRQQFVDEKGHIQDITGLWEMYEGQVKSARKETLTSAISTINESLKKVQEDINDAKGGTNIAALRILEQREKRLQEDLKNNQKKLDELNKQNEGSGGTEGKKPQNKEYWEEQKKNAEMMRNALEVHEVNSANWKKYTAQIIEADKQLAKYKSSSTINKDAEQKAKEEQKIAEAILSMTRQNQQDEINLMAEGSEKKRKQIELNYQREIDEVKKQKKAWEDVQNGVLTKEQRTALGNKASNAMKTRESGLVKLTKDETELAKQTMNEYLKKYGSYMEKRKAITDIYTEKINKATTKGEKLTLGEEMKRELAAVDDSVRDKTSTISKLFGDMSKKTVSDMRAIAYEAQNMLSYIESGEFKPQEGSLTDSFGFTKEQYELLKASPEQLEAIKNEIANLRGEADKAEPLLKKMAKSLEDIFSGKTDNFDENLGNILGGVGQITQAAEFLGDSLSSLSDAFGGNFLGGLAEGIGVATEAANAAMSGAQAGKVFGPWGAAAGAAIGAVTSLASSFAKLHDKNNERKIQKIQEQIDVLEKSYERLGDEIEDAYSKDASKLIQDQNKLLEQQKVLIQNQIKEEEKKKKTDNDRIKEWKEQIEEINKTISENKEAAVDAIFGSDLKSAIDEFTSAYVEAWRTGEDRAKTSKEVVESMIKGMITEAIKASASAPMEKIRQKLLEFWSDSFISAAEQEYINNMAIELQEKLDKQFGWADNLFKEENEVDTSSVDDFISSVSNGLQSLEVTAKDVSDNIYDYFRQAMINALYDKTYAEAMKKLYEEFESYMSDNSISDEELNILSEKIDSYVSQISSGIGKINEMFADKLKEEKPEEDIEDGFKSFSDSILSIMSNAETEAEDIANNISNNLRQKLFESMYVEQYEPRIKEIWEEWKKITSDGVVTDEERERIKQNIQDISNEVVKASKEMSEGWVEAGEEVNEAFKSFSESIRSVLYNAESTAEDVAKNIYEYMRKAFIDASFASQLEPLVQEWFDLYEGFNADNLISDTERAELDKLIADISKAGESLNDAANKLFPSLDTGAQKAAKEAEEAARKAEEEAREAAEKAAAEAQRIREQAESEWQSFSDNIVSSLYDIEATSADISKDMGETMRQALIKAMYVKNYEPQMRKWYNAWQSAMGDGSLTDDEKSTLDSMKDAIINDAMKEVNAINQMFGSIYSQEATAKGFSAMSQETGEELNGRFTAIQIASEEMKNCVLRNVAIFEEVLTLKSQSNAMLSDILAQQAISNGYLSDIAKYTKAVSLFGDKLDSIVQNTKNL